MLKSILLSLIALFISFNLSSQITIRHLNETKEIKVGGLFSGSSYGAQLGGVFYLNSKYYYKGELGFEKGSLNKMLYEKIYLVNSINRNVINISDNLFFDLSGGASIGHEYAKSNVESSSEDKFIYGLVIGALMKVYVNNNMALYLCADQYFGKSSVASQHYYFSLGLIYTINNKRIELK